MKEIGGGGLKEVGGLKGWGGLKRWGTSAGVGWQGAYLSAPFGFTTEKTLTLCLFTMKLITGPTTKSSRTLSAECGAPSVFMLLTGSSVAARVAETWGSICKQGFCQWQCSVTNNTLHCFTSVSKSANCILIGVHSRAPNLHNDPNRS